MLFLFLKNICFLYPLSVSIKWTLVIDVYPSARSYLNKAPCFQNFQNHLGKWAIVFLKKQHWMMMKKVVSRKISHGCTCFIENLKMIFEQYIICMCLILIKFSIRSARKRGFLKENYLVPMVYIDVLTFSIRYASCNLFHFTFC